MKTILMIAAIAAVLGLIGYTVMPIQAEEVTREIIVIDEPRPKAIATWIDTITYSCADGKERTNTPDLNNDERFLVNMFSEDIHHAVVRDDLVVYFPHIDPSQTFLSDAVEIQGGQFTVTGFFGTLTGCETGYMEDPIVFEAEMVGLCNGTEWNIYNDQVNVTYSGKAICLGD